MKTHGVEFLKPGRGSDTPPVPPARAAKNVAAGAGKKPSVPTVPGKREEVELPLLPDDSHEHSGKTGRPIWSGSITIGLINVPVRFIQWCETVLLVPAAPPGKWPAPEVRPGLFPGWRRDPVGGYREGIRSAERRIPDL